MIYYIWVYYYPSLIGSICDKYLLQYSSIIYNYIPYTIELNIERKYAIFSVLLNIHQLYMMIN